MKFIHLHVHSHYSLLDGMAKINDLIEKAKEQGMDSLALTDHGNLYGAVEFYKKAKKAGIKPILGLEAYIAPNGLDQKRAGIDGKRFHITLLAKNNKGWENLVRLVTKSHLEGFYYKPRIDKLTLKDHSDGLICLSGCPAGELAKAISEDNKQKAETIIKEYREIFGEDYYLEIQPHMKDLLKSYIGFSEKFKIPLVATQDVHYVSKDDKTAHEILLAVQTSSRLDDEDRLSLRNFDISLKSPEEMIDEFKNVPEAIINTARIAEKCNVEIEIGKPRLPKFSTPENYTAQEYLKKLTTEKLTERYPKPTKEIKDRLEHELGVIEKTGFADYFLIVQDFVNWAKERGIIVGPGRGSAAGSIVSYILGITNIDPIKYDLLFERFLNPDRIQVPDIDIDFTDTRRDEVIAYVREKYGRDRVAQIITFGTMMARASIRDTGRAMGLPYGFCDKIAKLIPFNSSIEEALNLVPELKSEYSSDSQVKELLDYARKLEGVARHASVHACGVVISAEPLDGLVPLQWAPQGQGSIITQFEMGSVDDLGLLKMDFLGLRNLTIIEKAIRLIKENHGEEVDLESIPLNNEKAFELLRKGKTAGIFQLESSGISRYLKEIKPNELEDIIAIISLYRPGPMELIPHYIKRKFGREKITYLHPKLEPILKKTYGVGIYQEQMMRIARDLAGFTLAEADILRKAIGKKIKHLLDEQKEKLINGMIKNKIDPKTAQAIWDLFPPFARYGFNRCVTGDTKILNPKNGNLIPIKEIHGAKKKEKTLSLNKDLKLENIPITNSYYNGKKKVWKLRTRSGREITATANHPFLTPNGWQELSFLKKGGKIAVPRRLPEPAKPAKVPRYKLATLGYLLAEGNFCHPHSFYFYSKDEKEVNDYLSNLEKFENTTGKIDRSKPAIAVYAKRKNLKLPSEAVVWIESLDLKYKKATEKFFPGFAFNLSNKDLAVIIGKMFQGDGCINIKRFPEIFYATSSKEMATGLQHLLLRFGILSTIHEKQFKYRGTIKPGYTVTISRYNNIEKFIKSFGKYFVGEKVKTVRHILENHPILNGSIKPWAARGSFDTVPVELVRSEMREAVAAGGGNFREFKRQHNLSWRLFVNDKRKIGYLRETVGRVAEITRNEELSKQAGSDIYWDKIKSIRRAGTKDTYDLTIPKEHNYVANDIIVHNSHGASYAMISYQTAYLKANWPVEFMTSLLNVSATDVDRINFFVNEASKLGIKVLPPDVNASFEEFTAEEGNIRFGLLAIKNLGANIVKAIIDERMKGGAYADISDFLKRIQHRDLNKKSLESLIKSGALDSIIEERGQALENIDEMLRFNQAIRKVSTSNQSSLFGSPTALFSNLILKPGKPVDKNIVLGWEKELLGLYLTGHPFHAYMSKVKNIKVEQIKVAVQKKTDSPRMRLAGVITGVQRITTKSGKPMLFVKLEDLSDNLEILVFSETLAKTEIIWQPNKAVIVEGKLSWQKEEPKFICDRVKEL